MRAPQAHPQHAYLPLLVAYTHEDAAAKGLRKLASQAAVQRPVHFTALEMAGRERLLMLTGEHGSGKTSFAQHLVRLLSGQVKPPQAATPVPRNDQGDSLPEAWPADMVQPLPVYLAINGPQTLAALLTAVPVLPSDVLLIIDDLERLADAAPAFLQDVAALAAQRPAWRFLLLGASEPCAGWVLPAALRRHALLPLLAAQRTAHDARPSASNAAVLANPARFLLSLQVLGTHATDYALIRAWLLQASGTEGDADALALAAFQATAGEVPTAAPPKLAQWLDQRYLLAGLAAQHLATLPAPAIAALFAMDPERWRAPLLVLTRHWQHGAPARLTALAGALTATKDGQPLVARLLVAQLLEADFGALQAPLMQALRRIVEEGALALPLRIQAGRLLARHGDPRALDALVSIPAGSFVMGSESHPNSSPPHRWQLDAYRIGRYPVNNGQYRAFADATGRHWHSPNGREPERASMPAVDLSWHDARAYCAWLTSLWRSEGRIGMHEVVRLPTEPEWEYAARGAQPEQATPVYPWGSGWRAGHCNGEDSGLNDVCTVGLFPAGRSLAGCDDMAGQVWEWTSTLWGSEMAAPSFRYPYADDGRENAQAPAQIRRVLRGGCFSSGPEKANCSYRGSLEPDGFWRGNGFRIVVQTLGRRSD